MSIFEYYFLCNSDLKLTCYVNLIQKAHGEVSIILILSLKYMCHDHYTFDVTNFGIIVNLLCLAMVFWV